MDGSTLAITPITATEAARLLKDAEAAAVLNVEPQTLRYWRLVSRRTGKLIGPRWVEMGSGKYVKSPRYRLADLIACGEHGAVALTPVKRRGRRRKTDPAAPVTATTAA